MYMRAHVPSARCLYRPLRTHEVAHCSTFFACLHADDQVLHRPQSAQPRSAARPSSPQHTHTRPATASPGRMRAGGPAGNAHNSSSGGGMLPSRIGTAPSQRSGELSVADAGDLLQGHPCHHFSARGCFGKVLVIPGSPAATAALHQTTSCEELQVVSYALQHRQRLAGPGS
jgi:hypothetical protein